MVSSLASKGQEQHKEPLPQEDQSLVACFEGRKQVHAVQHSLKFIESTDFEVLFVVKCS